MIDFVLADLLLRGKTGGLKFAIREREPRCGLRRAQGVRLFRPSRCLADPVTGGAIALLQVAFLGFLRYPAVCRLTSNYKISLNFQL
jgi:hypothetical protein